MSFKKQLILLFITFHSCYSFSQNGLMELYQNGYYIKQYSELSGLVNNKCKYVFEDSKGFLWISTFQGLSRFDGQRFSNFGLKEGLPSLNISQVCEDSSGYIYVATAKGIARYTGQRAGNDTCFYIYKETTNLASTISGMQVIDSSTIVFQQIGRGLYLLQNKKLSVLWNGIIDFEMSVLKDREHNIYAYSKDSFHVYNKYLKPLKNIFFPSANYMTFYYDNNNNMIQAYANKITYQLNVKGLSYSSNAPDSISWFWVADGGKKIYYSKSRTDLYLFDGTKSSKILDLTGLSLYSNDLRQTKDGCLWLTTSSGGLLKIVPLPYQEVKSHFAICQRNMNSRNIIDPDYHPIHLPSTAATFNTLKNTIINSVFTAKNGNQWFCTSNGIYMQEPGKKAIQYLFNGNEKLYSQRSKEIKGVVEDINGDMWFYGYCGIIHYSKNQFKQYTNRNGLGQDLLVRQLVIDKSGTVLATDWYNLYKVQGDTLLKIGTKLGLANFIPNKIAKDNRGSVWVDYNKKLFKIEKTQPGNFVITDSIIPFQVIQQSEITTFEFDGNNNCWIGYNGGAIRVFFSDKKGNYTYNNSITYTIEDGLIPVTGGEYNFYTDINGNMTVLTGKKGSEKLFVFSMASAVERKKLPPIQVSITEMLVNQITPDWKLMGYKTGATGIPVNPKFRFTHDDITFSYTGTSMRNAAGFVYQIMLAGYNNEWITTTQSIANYTNLPPGEYSFKVRAANLNGVWSDTITYDFVILPPWYKTWWGISILVFLAGLLIFLLFYFRLRAIRKEESLAHLKKSDQFKTMLISLLGHDIIIPLQYIGKVALQLKNYKEKLSAQTVSESLGDIHLTSSQLQLYGESIIHWIKVQNSEVSPLLYKKIWINDILDELIAFHLPLCTEKNNSLVKESVSDLTFSQDPLMIKIILHNLILNSNKFTANGKIILGGKIENDWLILCVEDTGKGMSEEKVLSLNNFKPLDSNPGTNEETGWGLGYIIIMDLLKFSKGTLHVESKINEGTKIIARLPLYKVPV